MVWFLDQEMKQTAVLLVAKALISPKALKKTCHKYVLTEKTEFLWFAIFQVD